MEHKETPIARFARLIGKPLYWYQIEIANAILDSIDNNDGHLFTVMMSRQSGKNQLSALLEAFLLVTRQRGNIIKAAPTFNPQIITSRRRLLSMLEHPYLSERIWTSYGMVGLAPSSDRALVRRHVGPAVTFYSAGPESNVVGATADILLEIDEAQDVTPEKFDKDFRPMASTHNATTIMYGMAWSDDTLLAQQQATNQMLEERDGIKRHFHFDWRTLAAINPNYRKFVEREIERLGEEHPAIRTQYLLIPISGAGYWLSELQRILLQGTHRWEDAPLEEGIYIAGMDVAGEERPSPDGTPSRTRDSSVLTIGRVRTNDLALPGIEVVHQQWWTGIPHADQYAATSLLVEYWGIRKLVIDATGLGEGLASLLVSRFGEERVVPWKFTRPSKSRLAYQVLALINSSRLKVYAQEEAPAEVYEECWHQLRKARYRLPAAEIMDFYVDQADGHDDFVISLALLTEGLRELTNPAVEAALVKPVRLYTEEGRY